ncbi:FAD binding domain-containing protein [Lentinula boryana]|uniref:FAD binding domain-containing protein n=1 Tax=Lentinula boryana TaxID=40481 RepID=A0ABQ8Q2U3_9AGAR|nr:FAD binding domain-containing protein [Lentinula boryana]
MSATVLIAGAGTSGLALALSLLRNGLSVRIVEKQLHFHPGERGAGLQSRTLELYKFLGILPDILERSASETTLRNVQYLSAPDDGKPPRIVHAAQESKNSPARPLVETRFLGQNRHEQLLREHILAEYGVQVELGTELQSFEQHPDHVVARLAKIVDSNPVEETVSVNWLVGADGARSVVRKQLGLSFLGESPEMEAVTGDIHVIGETLKQDQGDGLLVWIRPDDTPAGFMRPCLVPGKNLFQFIILGNKDLDLVKISSSREEMIKAFHEITGKRDIEFGELVWMGLWKPNIRMVDSFGNGRVFVVGDAAHVHSPTGGQGMNSGVQDSFNLAWKLALVEKGAAPVSILKSYSDERTPVIASMLNMTTELFRKELAPKPGQRQDFVRGSELLQLGINYRGSLLVLDEKYTDKDELVDPYRSGDDGTVRAGDRAPDAPSLTHLSANENANIISLFDIFTTVRHTVLIFPGTAGEGFVTEVLEALREYPSNLLKSILVLPRSSSSSTSTSSFAQSAMTLIDTEGYGYVNYMVAADTPTVFIVRPDGYIGALVTSGRQGVRSYFSGIFL